MKYFDRENNNYNAYHKSNKKAERESTQNTRALFIAHYVIVYTTRIQNGITM